jgi:excisionase family DNA binding protein
MGEGDFPDIPRRLITKTEAAIKLGISRITLYKWIKNHKFPVVKVGNLERIDNEGSNRRRRGTL